MVKHKVLLIIAGLFLLSCGKENQSYIPYVPVNIQFPATDPRIQGVRAPGNGIEISGGVGGIILYRKLSGNRLVAYDKRSPASLEKGCNVVLQSPSVIAEDICASVTYSLENEGTVIKGQYSRPLQQYNVSESNGSVFIYN